MIPTSQIAYRPGRSSAIAGLVLALFILIPLPDLPAQLHPKRELRAAWIATVRNIDWPSQKGLTVNQQQEEFVRLLDTLRRVGMNAVIVQVRSVADALYPSSYEPWSEYLSGSQGQPSLPYYNPLSFMIEQARQRGIEFHAWFNPYRASMDGTVVFAENHPIKKHPEWFVQYGGKYYYDPGHPDAREFVLQTIMETVKHYDLDAVHFDDYFYPYRIANIDFPDSTTWQTYGQHAFENIDDWRRNNVDYFVEQLSRRIKMEKPHLKFGISPFGVWRNVDKDSTGSQTRAGQTNYDDLFADVIKWLREGWIDYVTPQLYWHIGFEVADYEVLVDWWSKNSYGKHLYIGHGIYRLGSKGWEDPEELFNQVTLNRKYPNIKGSMFFSAKSLLNNTSGVNGMMKRIYPHKALVPDMPWLETSKPPNAEILNAVGTPANGVRLEWRDAPRSTSSYYVIYRFSDGDTLNIDDPSHIRVILPRTAYAVQSWVDDQIRKRTLYTYIITTVNRLHNESSGSDAARLKTLGKRRTVRMMNRKNESE